MQPFRDLIKAKSEFVWNDALQMAFNESKKVIINLVKEGVTTFDLKRVTCLAPDWSSNDTMAVCRLSVASDRGVRPRC